MVDFFEIKRNFQKNFIKKEIPHPSSLNALQDHYNDSSIMLYDILIHCIIHFKRKKEKINKRRI